MADGLVDQVLKRAVSDDASLVNDHDPIGSLFGFVQMVCGQHERSAVVIEFVQHLENPLSALRVDSYRGFIEQDDLGTVENAAGDVDSPLHASRKNLRPVLEIDFPVPSTQVPRRPVI